jgi:ADP-heptose:LPS heptosyltransferase
MKFKPKRFLLIHPFGIGDALFLTPVIRALHENGAEKIDLLLGSRTRAIFEKNPQIERIFELNRDRLRHHPWFHTLGEIASLLGELKQNRYDAVLDFSLGRQCAFFAWIFLGIRERIGFNYKGRGFFLNRKIELPQGFRNRHVIEYYAELLDILEFPGKSLSLDVFISEEDEREADQWLLKSGLNAKEPFLAIAPGGGESWGKDARLKRWSPLCFAELTRKIRLRGIIKTHNPALIIGGRSEEPLAQQMMESEPEGFLSLCGKISLRAVSVILKKACFLIANDGGLVHLATAVRTPVLAIFGPVDPKVYGPYPDEPANLAVANEGPECRPCYQNFRMNASCITHACMKELKPGDVFEELIRRDFFTK